MYSLVVSNTRVLRIYIGTSAVYSVPYSTVPFCCILSTLFGAQSTFCAHSKYQHGTV